MTDSATESVTDVVTASARSGRIGRAFETSVMSSYGKRPGTVVAYLRLVRRKRYFIPAVWILQSVRQSPVYLFPWLLGHELNLVQTNPGQAVSDLRWVMPSAMALLMINVITGTMHAYVQSVQRRELTASLRSSLMRRLHRLTFAFHDSSTSGELQNRFLLDTQRLEALQSFLADSVLGVGTSMIITICMVAAHFPGQLWIILTLVPINVAIVRWMWSSMKSRNKAFREAETDFLSVLNEALIGMRLTRVHASEDFAERRLGVHADRVAAAGVKADTVNSFFACAIWCTSQLMYWGVVGFGVWMAKSGSMKAGDLFMFASFYALIASNVGGMVGGLPIVTQAADSIQSLGELYASERDERDHHKPKLDSLTGHICLENVSFKYAGNDHHCLSNVSLDIPAGTSLALVGHSGSGKSTIASLVLGLYEPNAGRVTIDGYDLGTIDRRSMRRFVGVVSQEVVLFHDTVYGNITWGDPRPDAERAKEAARRANAEEFITDLPRGYDTMVGDRGLSLSGGQRQRLAIARALYRDPRLLILDEATSALDPESERLVQRALNELMRGRTTIIIAHRLSTVRGADRIAVLEHGLVAEVGTYKGLSDADGAFARLAAAQWG